MKAMRGALDGLIKNGVKKIETRACLKEQSANEASQEKYIHFIFLEC